MAQGQVRRRLLVILDRTSVIVTLLTAVAILHIRTAHSLWFGVGALVALATAKFLKLCIQQPRPHASTKVSYGMPSTHSSSIAFFGIYLGLATLYLPIHPRIALLVPGYSSLHALAMGVEEGGVTSSSSSSSSFSTPVSWTGQWKDAVGMSTRMMVACFWILSAGAVGWSRIRLGYHTGAQVAAGFSVGATIAGVWLWMWMNGVRECGLRAEQVVGQTAYMAWQSHQRGEWAGVWQDVAGPVYYSLRDGW